MVVSPSITTCESMIVPAPIRTPAPDDGVGADAHARPRAARRGRRARRDRSRARAGSRPAGAGAPRPRGARRSGPRPRTRHSGPRRCRTVTSRRSWSPGTAGRRNLASSMPTTWTSRRRGSGASLSSQMPAAWASPSMSSTPGITGAPGKWPSKNSSDPVTFLMATMPPGRIVLDDAVHEDEGVLGGDLADERCDVDGFHGGRAHGRKQFNPQCPSRLNPWRRATEARRHGARHERTGTDRWLDEDAHQEGGRSRAAATGARWGVWGGASALHDLRIADVPPQLDTACPAY